MKKQPINKRNSPLSKEKLKAILSDPGNPDLVTELANDPFASEALEGFKSTPDAMNDLEKLENRFSKSTNSGGVWKILKPMIFILTGAISTFIIITLTDKSADQKINESTAKNTAESHISSVITTEKSDSIELLAIDNSKPIPEEKQITYKKFREEQPTTVLETSGELIPETSYSNPIPTIEEKTLPEEKSNLQVARSNVKFKYLEDLKVIDYSGLYTNPIKKREIDLAGTPANMENELSERPDPIFKIVQIPYEDFLEESLSLFKNNDYKNALKNFMTILDHYPDDLNAFFYGGLCYYNIGKSNKAIDWFNKCIYNSYSTFEEEAIWYKALCLLDGKNNQKNEGKKILMEIVEKNGFYSERAKEKLSQL